MKNLLLMGLPALLIIACSQKKKEVKWPQAEIDAFTENCIANAKRGISEEKAVVYCDCMLNKIMVKYPDINDAEKITMGETIELAKECSK